MDSTKAMSLLLAHALTHNDNGGPDRGDVIGTSYRNRIDVGYDDLLRSFGQPLVGSGDGKVRATWILRFDDDTIVTIYDYKQTAPLGVVRRWHLGTQSTKWSARAVDAVIGWAATVAASDRAARHAGGK